MFKRMIPILLAVFGVALLMSAPASATVGHFFLGEFDFSSVPVATYGGLQSVAVDQATHDVYVLNESGEAVEQFEETGKYAGVKITGAGTPQGAFSFAKYYSSVAVDN